jgi:hypothetical protein
MNTSSQISSEEANEYREIIADIKDAIIANFNSQTLAKYIPTVNGNVITSTPVGYVIKDENKNVPFQMDLLSNNLYTHTACKLELATRFSDIIYKEQEEIKGNTIITKPGLNYKVFDGYFNDDPTYFVNNTPLYQGISTTITLPTIQTKSEYVSVEWFGYVIPKTGDSITFGIEGDDACYLWIGNKAINDYSNENADVKNGGLHGMVNETKIQIFLNPGELYPIRIQYGQNAGGKGFTLTINGAQTYDILYTLTKNDIIYKQKQQYYALVEDTPEKTAMGLFKCYITNMDTYPETENAIQNLNSTSSTTLTDDVEFEIIKRWGTGNPGSYAKVDSTGFHLYDSTGVKTPIQTIFSKTDSKNYWVELATYGDNVVININVDTTILSPVPFSKNYSNSVACRKWKNDKERNRRIYYLPPGGVINENNYLISNNFKYKLSISKEGQLVLLRAKLIPKWKKVDSNSIEFIYSNANFRYLYNFRCNPRMNKMYYVDKANNQLNFIPYNSKFLTSTGNFSEFSSYVPQTISSENTTKGDSTYCKNSCNSNTLCSAVYSYKSENVNKCQYVFTSNENVMQSNLFNYIQPNSSITSSTLYIKDKQIKMSGNIGINGPSLSSEDGYKTYSAYTIGPSMTTAPVGLEDTPDYKQLANEECEILNGKGNCEQPQPQQTQGFQGFEGFTPYNPADCANYSDAGGCKKFIQTYKIDPLIKTATDYSKALQKMEANNTTFTNNLTSYNTTYDDLSKNSVYQFRAEHTDFNNTKKSLLETANDDLDELLIQQNNMYIIGTITTATLLITAILLSSS